MSRQVKAGYVSSRKMNWGQDEWIWYNWNELDEAN